MEGLDLGHQAFGVSATIIKPTFGLGFRSNFERPAWEPIMRLKRADKGLGQFKMQRGTMFH
jgi:hypothetical protein